MHRSITSLVYKVTWCTRVLWSLLNVDSITTCSVNNLKQMVLVYKMTVYISHIFLAVLTVPDHSWLNKAV